jgi:hypothetical protein
MHFYEAAINNKVHKEKFLNLYALLNIIRVIKSRLMRWVEHVACMGEMRKAYRILVKISEGKRIFKRCRLRGRMILKRKLNGAVGCGLE